MEPQYIEHDLWTEQNGDKISLTLDKHDMSGINIPIAMDQRPQDMAMIAIKILSQCTKVDPRIRPAILEYFTKYL